MVTFAAACSVDESKLRAPSRDAPDGAIDHSADSDALRSGTEAAMEVGQVDSGVADQLPPAAGSDATLDQIDLDSGSAPPDAAVDAATDRSADRDVVEAGTGPAVEVGQVDSGAPDQTPPDGGSDVPQGEDGQEGSDVNPDAVLDAGIDDSADTVDQAPPADASDASWPQDSRDSRDASPDTDPDVGPGIVPNGTYRVIARHSGKVLDVYGEATADGSNVDQWTYDGGNNQRWTFTHLGGNVYKILGVQSGKALEVATTSTADDANVDIRTYTGRANQQWTISAVSGGYFRLTPMSSRGSALDVYAVSMADGANVHQWTWLGGNNLNQQWTLQAP
jgi:hypothetical protein